MVLTERSSTQRRSHDEYDRHANPGYPRHELSAADPAHQEDPVRDGRGRGPRRHRHRPRLAKGHAGLLQADRQRTDRVEREPGRIRIPHPQKLRRRPWAQTKQASPQTSIKPGSTNGTTSASKDRKSIVEGKSETVRVTIG